jgi:DNA-binding NtrC family response regulator
MRSVPESDPREDLVAQQRLQGLAILQKLRRERSELPVILMTSQEELAYQEPAQQFSSDEFVTLAGADAFDARALGLLIERLLVLKREAPASGGYLFGTSPTMTRLRREAQVLGRTALPMLILGETGTGKSALCEQVIHPVGERRGPFVSVDLSAIPETLIAAELFGVARGAYSGAVEREGRFERASGGTLLLDEIGNLPLEVQRMLLLVLQEGRVTRLGENTPRSVQVKVVAATHVDLGVAVQKGRFRADLYARLNPAARLVLPPLRERREDLEPLLQGLLRKTFSAGPNRQLLLQYCDAAGLTGPPQVALSWAKRPPAKVSGVRFLLSPLSMAAIRQHSFPGNIRELELLIASAALLSLADALHAAQKERAVPAVAHTIPIPNQLMRRLLDGGWPSLGVATEPVETPHRDASETGTGLPLSAQRLSIVVEPGRTLHEVAQDIERQVYEQLYERSSDFGVLAKQLLVGRSPTNARRVRLRYNQLGLRVREPRSSHKS